MKKNILILALLTCFLSSCSKNFTFISPNGSEIIKIDDDYNHIYVTPPYLEDQIFLGYFTEETGGKQIFDENGKNVELICLFSPNKLYAQYESIDNYRTFSGKFTNKTYSGGDSLKVDIPDKLKMALQQNQDKDVKITISMKFKSKFNYDINFKLYGLGKNDNYDEAIDSYVIKPTSEYTLETFTFE